MFVQRTDQEHVRGDKEGRTHKLLNTQSASRLAQEVGRAAMARFGIAFQLTRRTAAPAGWRSGLTPGLSTSTQTSATSAAGGTQCQQAASRPVTNERPAPAVRHSGHRCWHPPLPTHTPERTGAHTDVCQNNMFTDLLAKP